MVGKLSAIGIITFLIYTILTKRQVPAGHFILALHVITIILFDVKVEIFTLC